LSVERSELNVERSAPKGAVFLSYAREDTEAARRIADALRAFGVEVWFDQSELRGGDSWDAKIKKQIRECALFVPLVSVQTQERTEGYFRREWLLAVERTRDMAHGVAFIVPVVIDDTREADAAVPEEFMRFQWTRLAHGVPSPQFVEQVQRLLEAPRKAAPAGAQRTEDRGQRAEASGTMVPSRSTSKSPVLWAVVALGAIALALGAYFALRPNPAAPAAPTPSSVLRPPAADAKSIAVLPFENMSEDKDTNAFFADGIHEDVLTNLAFIRDVRVVSRTSVMQYRNTTKPISQIAQELKVTYVLEGSVRRAGNKIRVTGQLIRAATDEHVWAKAYDRDVTDVFAIQSELAQAIADALQSVIAPETKALLERRLTDNPAAYDLFLQERALENVSSYADLKEEAALLQRAVDLDPKFAAAWATLGGRQAFIYFKTEQTPEQLALAKTAIEQAVRLAPDDPEVIQGLGDYYYYGYRDYPRATEQYLRLVQMRPNDAGVVASLGFIQRRQGRMPDALVNFRRALQLDPLNGNLPVEFVSALLNCRRYAEAEAFARPYLQAHPAEIGVALALAQTVFAAHSATAELKSFAQRTVAPADRAQFHYLRLQAARATADWAEAIRLDREERYFDFDSDAPRWLQDVLAAATFAEAGDLAASRARAADALAMMNGELPRQPLNAQLWAALSLVHALLGEHDEALRCGDKARELLPESRDALIGTANSALCASALAYAGEKDRALAEFARLLHVPYGTNPVLERGIWLGSWQPLRGDPRFQALLNDPKNNQPLF
jgi:TolB-like protein/cytochrome c-type biogenesis protein CcmH/NrfG